MIISRNFSFILLVPFTLALANGASCGNHNAATCKECPMNEGNDMGSSWCNGDCEWKEEQCKLLGSDPSTEIISTPNTTITASKVSQVDNTSCGNHNAATCKECPMNEGNDMGESWCNGDCEWKEEQCKLLGSDSPTEIISTPNPTITASKVSTNDTFVDDVSCGNHNAATCAECPMNKDGIAMGESWCNGDCEWKEEQCKLPGSDPPAEITVNIPTSLRPLNTESPTVPEILGISGSQVPTYSNAYKKSNWVSIMINIIVFNISLMIFQ